MENVNGGNRFGVLVAGGIVFLVYAFFNSDLLQFHAVFMVAKLTGYSEAQHIVGQKYLHGLGVDQDPEHAMDWFRKAADQGHAHACHNLAVGHLKGIRTDLVKRGETHKLVAFAANNGVLESRRVLQEVCAKGGCND